MENLTDFKNLTYREKGVLTLVDKYIAKSFLGYFLGALVVVVTLYVAVDAMSSMMANKPTITAMIQYYAFSLPNVIYQMTPVACIFATVFTLSAMNKSNELVALFSMGMSLARIAGPLLILTALIAATVFFLGDRLIPLFNQKKNFVYFVEIKKQPGMYQTVKTDRIWYKSGNVIFNLQTLNPEKKLAQRATFYYFDEAWKLIQMITAKELTMQPGQWELANGTVTVFSEDSSFPLSKVFQKKSIVMEEKSLDLTESSASSAEMMSLSDLKRFIKKNRDAGLDTLRYEMDYQSKFSFAFASFVMTLLGIPFSVKFNRQGGRMKNLAICLGLTFVYWALYSSAVTVGRHGMAPPIVAAWVPNVFMVILTLYFLVRLKR